MQDWGGRYPHAGYGGRFRHWLKEKNPKPYGSYGNGSAMRVENLPRLLSLLPENFFEETFKDYKLIFHERSVSD